MKTDPIEPEIEAIGRDAFLKAVVDQQQVRNKLDSFKWDGKIGLQRRSSAVTWHFGIPVKRVQFTRLNGDDRSFRPAGASAPK